MENLNLDRLLNDEEEKPVDLRVILYSILDRLWVVALILVLVATIGFVYASRAPRIFAAKTVMIVDEERSKVVKVESVNTEDLKSAELLNTMVQSIQSREVLNRVVESLKLMDDARFLDGTGLTRVSPEQALGMLMGDVKVDLRKGTRLVDIVVEHRVPETATMIADSVAQEFLLNRFKQSSTNTDAASGFLEKESARLKEKLQKSEEALHQYKVDQNAFGLEENQNTIVSQLKDFNSKLTQAKAERLHLEGDAARAKEIAGKPQQLLALSSIAANTSVSNLNDAIAQKQSDLSVLGLRYLSEHPKYIAAQTELTNLREQRNQAVLKAADLLSSELRAAQETEAGLMKAVGEQESKASELNQKSIQYNTLTREMESNKAMYQSVLNRLTETDVTKQWNQTPIRVFEPGFAYGPVRPNKPAIIGTTISGGLILGLAVAFGLSMMDSSLKTVDEAEKLLGLPVLSAVPRRKVSTNSKRVSFPMIDDPKGSVAEAFRTLRSNLSLLGRQETRRSFLFTSAVPSEGKSFTCSNYAVVSAQMGIRTLLIDADLRRPAISPIFFGSQKKPGLAECLAGQCKLVDAAIPSEVPNLSVLPAGSTAPNPAELLSGSEFSTLLNEALLVYDRVIIDTAPVNAVSDTLMLTPHVQTVCLVVRAGATPRKSVMRAAKVLSSARCKPAGVILNYLPERHGIGYYYYYQTGEYGSAGVYGAKA